MRLFLSSEGFGNYPARLVELIGKNRRVIFIDNAKDDINPDSRAGHVKEKKIEFETLGFEFHELDLREYFNKSVNEAAELLSSAGLIWLSGGNTFILRRALAYSGLDKTLVDLLGQDKIVYGGSSAGSIIPTPSLRGTEYGDDPNSTPAAYKKEIIWEGLSLVPFHIVPHYGSDWFGNEAARMEQYLKGNNLPYRALKDGQVIVIDGNKEEFLK